MTTYIDWSLYFHNSFGDIDQISEQKQHWSDETKTSKSCIFWQVEFELDMIVKYEKTLNVNPRSYSSLVSPWGLTLMLEFSWMVKYFCDQNCKTSFDYLKTQIWRSQ